MIEDLNSIKTSRQLLDSKYKKTGLFVLYPFLMLIFFLFLFLFFGKKESYIESSGVILSNNVGELIVAPVGTKLKKIEILNNQNVSIGQSLFIFESSDLLEEKESNQVELTNMELQLEYLNDYEQSVFENSDKLGSNKYGYKSDLANFKLKIEKNNLEVLALENNIARLNISLERSVEEDSSISNYIIDYETLKKCIEKNVYGSYLTDEVYYEANSYFSEYSSLSDSDIKQSLMDKTLIAVETNLNSKKAEKKVISTEKMSIENEVRGLKKSKDVYLIELKEEREAILKNIETNRNDLHNQINQKKEMLKIILGNIEKLTIKAKSNGKIEFTDLIEEGKVYLEGTDLGRIINRKDMNYYLEVYIPSSQIKSISKNQKVKFIIPNLENSKQKPTYGRVKTIQTKPKQTEHGNFHVLICSIDSQSNIIYASEGKVNIVTGKTNYLKYLTRKFFK